MNQAVPSRRESTALNRRMSLMMSSRKSSVVSTRKESLVSNSGEGGHPFARRSSRLMSFAGQREEKRWQDAINRVSLNLKSTRKGSISTRGGSFHSDSEDIGDGPKQPAVLFENTFQLEPKDDQKFPTKKAEDVIKAIFNSNLRDKKYNSDSSKNLTTNLTELIRTQVKQELGKRNRFKIVVLVIIGSMEGQGVRCASRCLWYPQFDRFATYSYYNEHLFAVGTVYGVYYE